MPESRVPNILATLFIALFACALLGVVFLWRLRCEGFGCLGVGVAWLAWLGLLYVPALVLGLLTASKRKVASSALWRVLKLSLVVHVLVGAGLFVYWAVKAAPSAGG